MGMGPMYVITHTSKIYVCRKHDSNVVTVQKVVLESNKSVLKQYENVEQRHKKQ